jgi:hypothetical protein
MNEEIIVAVYDTEAHAAAAVRDLQAAHVPPEVISRHAGTESVSGSAVSGPSSAGGQGFGAASLVASRTTTRPCTTAVSKTDHRW